MSRNDIFEKVGEDLTGIKVWLWLYLSSCNLPSSFLEIRSRISGVYILSIWQSFRAYRKLKNTEFANKRIDSNSGYAPQQIKYKLFLLHHIQES